MKISRFFFFLVFLFVVALVVYLLTTPRGNEVQLTGIVMGTDAIVSPLVQGRLEKLLVDEGSSVKAGELIAEIDPTELETVRDSAAANIRTLQARVQQSATQQAMSDAQTKAAEQQATANLTAANAALEQAKATLALDQVTYQRDQGLFEKGVVAAQDRDNAKRDLDVAQANVKGSEDQVHAAEAQVAVSQANRKQVEVQQSDVIATKAQVAQAVAQRNQAATQLGYTKVYAPMDGVVSVRVARQGEVVQAGGPIVTILDIDHLWVETDVEESLISLIQFGQTVRIKMPSGEIVNGQVYFKGVENDYATQRDVSRTKRDIKTFSIKISIPNPDRRFFAGMTAYVLLPPPPSDHSWLHL